MLGVIGDGHPELLHAGPHRFEHEVAHDLAVVFGNEPIPLAVISRRVVLSLLVVDAAAGAVEAGSSTVIAQPGVERFEPRGIACAHSANGDLVAEHA
jgi:hypothetical protein